MNTLLRTVASLLLFTAVACGDDDATSQDDAAPDEIFDAAPPDASCYENPTTHFEIINACTEAESVDKEPDLPLLNEDGTLPDLPE